MLPPISCHLVTTMRKYQTYSRSHWWRPLLAVHSALVPSLLHGASVFLSYFSALRFLLGFFLSSIFLLSYCSFAVLFCFRLFGCVVVELSLQSCNSNIYQNMLVAFVHPAWYFWVIFSWFGMFTVLWKSSGLLKSCFSWFPVMASSTRWGKCLSTAISG